MSARTCLLQGCACDWCFASGAVMQQQVFVQASTLILIPQLNGGHRGAVAMLGALLRRGKDMWCRNEAGRSSCWWAPSLASSSRPLAAGRSGAWCPRRSDLTSSCAKAVQRGQEQVLHPAPSCRGAWQLPPMHDVCFCRAALDCPSSRCRAPICGVGCTPQSFLCVGGAPMRQVVWPVRHSA